MALPLRLQLQPQCRRQASRASSAPRAPAATPRPPSRPHALHACLLSALPTYSRAAQRPLPRRRSLSASASTAAAPSSSSTPPPKPVDYGPVALTLLLGVAGAAAAFAARAPLPFMLGSLFTTAAVSLCGAPLALPQSLRLGWLTVIGTALGSTFTVALLQRASSLSLSIAGLLLLTLLSTAVSATLFSKIGKFDLATSFFAAVPGGLADMTQMGADLGGSERTIALCHTIRLVTTVVLFPLLIRGSATALSLPPPPLISTPLPLTALDAILLASFAFVGPQLGKILRLPARFLVGPMVMSAALHLAGATDARPPPQLLQAAQVVVGAAVGTRFVGVRLEQLRGPAVMALCATVLQLLLATGAAVVLRAATGAPLALLLLSLSPGGITEMTLTALACGLDSAFVATHHTIRIVAITSLTPLLFALGKEAQRRRGLKSA